MGVKGVETMTPASSVCLINEYLSIQGVKRNSQEDSRYTGRQSEMKVLKPMIELSPRQLAENPSTLKFFGLWGAVEPEATMLVTGA